MRNSNEPKLEDFSDLYQQYYPGVANVVRSFKFFDGAADDLIQDIFMQAWQSMDSLRDTKAFSGWLMTIARNRCLNEVRRTKKMVAIDAEGDEHDSIAGDVVLIADDILASFHFEQSIELLRSLIQSHQGEPRASIAKMFYLDSMSVKEICLALDMKQNTVLSHLRRFRLIISKAMIKLLEEKEIEPV